MKRLVNIWWIAMTASMAVACSDDGSASGGTTEGDSSTGGGDDNGTLPPLTTAPGDDGVDDSATAPSTGSDDGGSSSGDPDDTGTGSAGDDSSSGSRGDEDSSTGDPQAVTIDWCRLQSPPDATVAVGQAFTVYGRVYVEGVTDQSVNNDPWPTLVAEFGWGEVDSDPAVDAWTWIEAEPNPGWDGTTFGEPNNDEYQAELAIDTAGTWHYAVRFSGDGGGRWVYCDLNDILNGGYTPDQAGTATVTE